MDSDHRVSKNIKKITKIRQNQDELAAALRELNENITKTFGISTVVSRPKGIYCIDQGRVELVAESSQVIDHLKKIEFTDQTKTELKITYEVGKTLLLS